MNPTETAELAELISRLREQRPSLSIVLVEHKMQFVRRLADRVLVLDQGKPIAAGKPDEVLALPQVVAAYLGSRRLASAPKRIRPRLQLQPRLQPRPQLRLLPRQRPLMGRSDRRRQPAAVLRQDFEAILELFPTLSSHLRQPAGTLSGGEQQLVAMARALLRRPQLLCIDEPSIGLSPPVRRARLRGHLLAQATRHYYSHGRTER